MFAPGATDPRAATGVSMAVVSHGKRRKSINDVLCVVVREPGDDDERSTQHP